MTDLFVCDVPTITNEAFLEEFHVSWLSRMVFCKVRMLVQCVVVVLGEDDALFVPHPPFPPFQTGFEYYSDGEWPQACARLLLCKVNCAFAFQFA